MTLGTVPLDFVLTDVLLCGEYYRYVLVLVNGTPVMNLGASTTNYVTEGHIHLTTGVPVPAGSTISIQASTPAVGSQTPSPITITGYLQ